MPRYFTHYWANDTLEEQRISGEHTLKYVASNQFIQRAVGVGDVVYPVTVLDGMLHLIGRLEVEHVCNLVEAREHLGYDPWWKASDYLVSAEAAPAHFDLKVPLEVARRLRFLSGNETLSPRFKEHDRLDQQTLRGVRELDPKSAAEFDNLLHNARGSTGSRLELYDAYSREEVHDIFSPGTSFTPQAGTWGLHGIVAIPDRPGDFVFFVTLGQQQGGHIFDEGITEDSVLSWQSQPRQGFNSPQIQEFIEHDELKNLIYLLLRTNRFAKYTYLGTLKYLSYDTERENPVYFQWQILNWRPSTDVLEEIGLTLQPSAHVSEMMLPAPRNRLEKTSPPTPRVGKGKATSTFRSRKDPDYSVAESRNRELGLKGERLVIEHEKRSLIENAQADLAEGVQHVSVIEGDGAGYDVKSYTPKGEVKYIEVKNTPPQKSSTDRIG